MSDTSQPGAPDPGQPDSEDSKSAKGFWQALSSALTATTNFTLEGLALAKAGGQELQSPLNAITGDRLAASSSLLAVKMRLRYESAATESADGKGNEFPALKGDTDAELRAALEAWRQGLDPDLLKSHSKGARLCVLIHGLGSTERTWRVRRTAAGAAGYTRLLARDTGHLCLFLSYNSGRHISENGRELAELLHRLHKNFPLKLTEINLIGHSMGGLVSRSAAYYGGVARYKWPKLLKRNLLLGSPLLGAHQEQIGKLTTDLVGAIPLPAAAATAKYLDVRSAGIQDLGYAYLRDEDWQQKTGEAARHNRRHPVPLLKHTRYCLITGALMAANRSPNADDGSEAKTADKIKGALTEVFASYLGDGIVSANSAAADTENKRYEQYENHSVHTIPGLAHTAIPGDARVYRRVRDWLRE